MDTICTLYTVQLYIVQSEQMFRFVVRPSCQTLHTYILYLYSICTLRQNSQTIQGGLFCLNVQIL